MAFELAMVSRLLLLSVDSPSTKSALKLLGGSTLLLVFSLLLLLLLATVVMPVLFMMGFDKLRLL